MISKKLAIDILNVGLSTGADYAEIFYEDSSSYGFTIENNKLETSHDSVNTGVGIRLLKDLQSVYGYTIDLSKKSLLNLASTLAASFKGERKIMVEKLKLKRYKTISPIAIDYNDVSKQEKVELVKDGLKALDGLDQRIVRTYGLYNDNHRNVIIYNSKGEIIKTNQQFGRAGYQVIASDGKSMEVGYEMPGTQDDINFFKTKKDMKQLAKKAAKVALQNLDAAECPSGTMPVVIGNGWGGVLFHEACGHPLEASAVSKGLSCFAGKMGEMIASPIVTAVDDSTIPHAWGSIDYDDEGIKGEKRILIKNGKLTKYMIDSFNGRRMNEKGNGACRRQSFRFEPTSRMSNTYIANGKSTPEEIISATKLGLYAVGFNGGSVNPTTGEFNFGCSEAYIIRDGKIAEPVKGAMLIGKGSEILHKIDMVGNDLDLAQGMCGASSGSIRTNVGQPTLRISEITVGGRGGELK